MAEIVINEQSPEPLRLAGVFYVWLGSREQDKKHVLSDWPAQFEAMLEESGLSFEEFRLIMRFAVKENVYTAENLVVARNPVASLWKQWENICRYYKAKLAGDKARARRSWKYGACVTCDEAEAERQGGDCTACADKKATAEFEELWSQLIKFQLARVCKRPNKPDAYYIGVDPERAIMGALSQQELKDYLRQDVRNRAQVELLLWELHPEVAPTYRAASVLEIEEDLE